MITREESGVRLKTHKIILVLITPNNIIETLRALFVDHTRLVVGLLIVH